MDMEKKNLLNSTHGEKHNHYKHRVSSPLFTHFLQYG